jgi:hypothetical protein
MARSIFCPGFSNASVPVRWALCCAVLVGASAGWAQQRAGQVMSVTGSVTATDAQGRQRVLTRGGDIHQGDRIATGEGALVQVRTTDGGYLSVRSATEIAIERFNYDEKESSNSGIVMELIKGGFRSITGLIGRTNPSAYSVRTATATVGIRGTDHEPVIVLPPPPGLPPGATGPAPGLYDKVNDGETFIRTQRGVLALTKGQIGFTPTVPDRPPVILPVVPDFYRVEVKTDARDPRDAAPGTQRTSDSGDGALRPSVAARREALKEAAAAGTGTLLRDATVTTTPLTTSILKDATTVISPTLTTTTLKEATLTSPTLSTTTLQDTSLLKDSSVLISPTTTTTTTLKEAILTSPTLSTTTTSTLKEAVLLSPTTTTTTTTTVAPTTATTTSTLKSILTSPTTTTTIKSVITK